MVAATSFQKLTRLIQRYESDGGCVKRVEAETTEMQTGTEMSITLDVHVSLCSGDESETTTLPTAATITEDGGLQVEFSSSALPTLDDYVCEDTTVNTEAVRIAGDGTVVTTFTIAFGEETEARHTDAGASASDLQARSVGGAAKESGTTNSTPSEPVSVSDTSEDVATESDSINHHDLIAAGTEASENDQMEIERELETVRNEDLPPYDDTEYLQCLYDSFDTFTEMAKNIEMDVASETVRRYMIEAGVHEPSSYNTVDESEIEGHDEETTDVASMDSHDGSDETDARTVDEDVIEDDGETGDGEPTAEEIPDVEPEDPIETVSNKPLVADGIGLPDDLEIEELADALESSMTLHQVQRQLGLSRERTREVLNKLNLTDLVMRRISHNPDRDVSRAEIADRIRTSASSTC